MVTDWMWDEERQAHTEVWTFSPRKCLTLSGKEQGQDSADESSVDGRYLRQHEERWRAADEPRSTSSGRGAG